MDLEKEIELLKQRNKKVEADKAWEISNFRKVSIIIITYITMSLVMYYLDFQKPFLNALIPTLGYTLSTLSLSVLKKIYLKYKK
ncbi:MAG: hypothetical protein PHE25_05165 [Candidatus Gracilibacteria bacterium]|nr:hypothetical protein [Candidatus Gracilibacteria bacterium]